MVRSKKPARSRSSAGRRRNRGRRANSGSRKLARRAVRIRMGSASKATSRRARAQKRLKGMGPQRAKIILNADYLAAVKSFEAGVVLFQKQSYAKAKEAFGKLATDSPPEVGSRAKAYVRMCEQKLSSAEPVRGAREHYNLGIAQLNARDFDAALENLQKAQKAEPGQEHVRYALAAVYALQGNSDAALEHLAAAIQLRPANRFLAVKDEDFQSVVGDPRFKQLIHSGVA